MTIALTTRAKAIAARERVSSQIILEIKGGPTLYGAVQITEAVRVGQDGLKVGDFLIGGVREIPGGKAYIALDGTTKNINTQMLQDKGGSTSISRFNIELLDVANEVTNELKAGNYFDDILAVEANVYATFEGARFPEDAVKIFNGIIDQFETDNTSVYVSVSSAERLLKQELFLPAISTLTTAITDASIGVFVDDMSDFFQYTVSENMRTFVSIDDEIIEVGSQAPNGMVIVQRAMFGTIQEDHEADTEVSGIQMLYGEPIDLALKLMLSDPDNTYFEEDIQVVSIGKYQDIEIENALFFTDYDLSETYGVSAGDIILMPLTTGGNILSNKRIISVNKFDGGSYLITEDPFPGVPLTIEIGNDDIKVSFSSQYNTLSVGCAMKPYQVDVAQHQLIQSLVAESFPDLEFILNDGISAKDFIANELYFPNGMYALTRSAKTSVGYTSPPLALFETKKLNIDSILNPETIKINRSINKYFYNAVQYQYERDPIEDKYLAGRITVDEDSNNRIKSGNQVLKIVSNGLKNNAATNTFLDAQAIRFLDRYKFAAESFTVLVSYQFGFNLEVGDRVEFYGGDIGAFLYGQGTRKPAPKVVEIIDKKMNIIDGTVSITCLDTVFGLSGRFTTFAPSTLVGSGATTTQLPLKKSFGTGELSSESDKWSDFIGDKVLVRSSDYSFSETVTLIAIEDEIMLIGSLSAAPSEDYIIEAPSYEEASESFKILHGYFCPQIPVVAGVSVTELTVDSSDIDKFFEGSAIQVHNADYTESGSAIVSNISGNNILLNSALSFVPDSSHLIDKVGFSFDNGDAYLYF